jgi:hypothetical protein
VGALGHYLEEEGIATSQISLIREHTSAIAPPRALWVPFILGRPLGVPGDARFQRRVLLAALRLLEARAGPVLEDYPEEAPEAGDGDEAFACPVDFTAGEKGDDASDLERELAQLAPWHDIALGRRGRTTAVLSGLSPSDAARFITGFIADPERRPYREDLTRPQALRLASADIKAFYLEAVAAQPGRKAAEQANDWFWRETAAGRTLLQLREVGLNHEDASVRAFASKHLVPRAILRELGRE